ncbi:MAG: ECF transporter S component [Gemmatimonadota bacterium]|nr:ECF transporter S component [Gemmatimonadota bacterium]
MLALALIPRAVALNLALGAVVAALKLPVFLDSVGTVLVAALAGPWAGMITGAVGNVILGLLSSPTFFAFIPVTLVIGALAGVAARLGAFRSLAWAIPAGMLVGVAAGSTSVPIVISLFGGATASGTGLVTIALRALHLPLALAAGIASVSTDVVDKGLSFALVALLITRLPSRITGRFARARRAPGRLGGA